MDKKSQIALRRKVRMFYDLQRLRLQAQGRGLKKGKDNPIELDPNDVVILNTRTTELHGQEKAALQDVQEHLSRTPFYMKVLSDKTHYKGIGPTMAGVILSSFDIEREDTPSKMWAFAGLKPIPVMRCRHCHKVVEVTDAVGGLPNEASATIKHPQPIKCAFNGTLADLYDSGRAQRPTAGEKLPYNKWLRTKLVGVLGPVMLKVGSPWRKFYDDYKARKTAAGWGINDGHRHQAAIRYMIKMLLLDIWREWRTFEGLEVRPTYHEEYLGHKHHVEEKKPATGGPVKNDTEAEVDAEIDLLTA